MSSAPKVSVIIAARDYGEFLPTALASVRSQSLQAWECIIVDDASTDNTTAVAAEAAAQDPRFRLIRNERNVGVSAARNLGIAEAKGAYIQFLDADDAIAPTKLERHAAFLNAHPGTGVVCSDFFHFTGAPVFGAPGEYRPDERLDGSGDAVLRRLLKGNTVRLNTVLVRTDAVRALGGFRAQFRAVEDWHLWMRIAAKGHRFAFLNDDRCMAAVRVNPRGLSKDATGMRRWQLPALQDLWAQGELSFSTAVNLLLRYTDFFLEMRFAKREPAVLLPDRRAGLLLRIVPLTLLMLPFWLLSRPFRGR